MNAAHTTRLRLGLCLSVFLCSSLLFFYRLADRELWSSHEARAAQNAQSMLDSGDWLLPRLYDGQVELQKPPLYYWLVAALGRLRGGSVDAWAVRWPAALAALGTVLLLIAALAARGRWVAGIIAGLVLATSQHFVWIARTGRLDVPLTLTVAIAVLGLHARCRVAWIAGWAAIATGVLLKGPIAVALPLAILTGDAALARILVGYHRRRVVPMVACGVSLVLLLALPWFVAAHFRTDGEFTRAFFWHHHVERALGGSDTLAVHPWWTYVVRWLIDPLPWSVFLIPVAWFSVRSSWLREDAVARLGVAWILAGTALLSASQFKRADYLLPVYPGMALVLGSLVDWRIENRGLRLAGRESSFRAARRLALGVHAVAGLAAIVGVAACHTIIPRLDADRSKAAFAAAIRKAAPRPEMVLFFRVEDHLLAFQLGSPVHTLLEWENLDVWAGRPDSSTIVMPAKCAAEWRQYISSGTLEIVLRYTDRTERRRPRDLVVMKTGRRHPAADGSDPRRSTLAARRP